MFYPGRIMVPQMSMTGWATIATSSGLGALASAFQPVSPLETSTLQVVTVAGLVTASLYATARIVALWKDIQHKQVQMERDIKLEKKMNAVLEAIESISNSTRNKE